MRKFIFLMLLLSSRLILSQVTSTNQSEPTKCVPVSQVTEIYKGLKQNEQLKKLLYTAQETIDNSNALISSQRKMNAKLSEESEAKSELIKNLKDLNQNDKYLCDIQKKTLQNQIKYLEEYKKKESRKSFWNGVKIGGVSVVALGIATFVLVNN